MVFSSCAALILTCAILRGRSRHVGGVLVVADVADHGEIAAFDVGEAEAVAAARRVDLVRRFGGAAARGHLLVQRLQRCPGWRRRRSAGASPPGPWPDEWRGCGDRRRCRETRSSRPCARPRSDSRSCCRTPPRAPAGSSRYRRCERHALWSSCLPRPLTARKFLADCRGGSRLAHGSFCGFRVAAVPLDLRTWRRSD